MRSRGQNKRRSLFVRRRRIMRAAAAVRRWLSAEPEDWAAYLRNLYPVGDIPRAYEAQEGQP